MPILLGRISRMDNTAIDTGLVKSQIVEETTRLRPSRKTIGTVIAEWIAKCSSIKYFNLHIPPGVIGGQTCRLLRRSSGLHNTHIVISLIGNMVTYQVENI